MRAASFTIHAALPSVSLERSGVVAGEAAALAE
jgi:hypothetical protein